MPACKPAYVRTLGVLPDVSLRPFLATCGLRRVRSLQKACRTAKRIIGIAYEVGASALFRGSFKPYSDQSALGPPMSREISLGSIAIPPRELAPRGAAAHAGRHGGCRCTGLACGEDWVRGMDAVLIKEWGHVGSAKVSRNQSWAKEAAADALLHDELPPPHESGGHAAER